MNAARRRQSKREEAASAWKTPATGVSTRRCPPTVQHGKQPSAPAGRARREQPCRGGPPHGAPGPQKRGGTSVRTRVTQSRATRFWCRLGGGGTPLGPGGAPKTVALGTMCGPRGCMLACCVGHHATSTCDSKGAPARPPTRTLTRARQLPPATFLPGNASSSLGDRTQGHEA